MKKIPIITCPYCGYKFDTNGAVGVHRYKPPVDGDYSVCIDCGEVGVFKWVMGELTSRIMTEDEKVESMANNTLNTVRLAWIAMKEHNRG